MQMQKLFSFESRINLILLLLIVLTGAVLRFVNFSHNPFTHDEIATVQQVNYPTISEVLEKEVMKDVHPPGFFVFVYYWTKLFGASEQAVKFPFIIFGILSIVLIYFISSKWFNPTVGLLSATLMSIMQYTIMYSNIARPYSSGLFFSLLVVWFMTKYFDAESKRKLLWLTGFVIAASCCNYNHYFSLMFAAIVCATGFVFTTKKNILQYFLACIVIAILFIPGLFVFFTQIGYNKGVGGPGGWLDKPDSSFMPHYLYYLFYYSQEFLILCVAIIIFGIVTKKNFSERSEWRYRAICLMWFLLPFIIGYIYSVKVNPVLQYSGLIFCLPYMVILVFSFLKDITPILKIAFTVFILSVGISTLVYGRKHYELFYNQGIHKIISEINSTKQQYGKNSVDAVIYVEDYFLKFYRNKFPVEGQTVYASYSVDSLRNFRETVSKSKANYFIFSTVKVYPAECIQILKDFFPFTVSEYKGHLTEIFCFSKIHVNTVVSDEIIFTSENNFSNNSHGWVYDMKKVFADSASAKNYFRYDVSDEYGVEFECPIYDVLREKNNILNASAEVMMKDTAASPLLVMTLENNRQPLDWRAAKFSSFVKPDKAGKVFLSVRFSDIHIDMENVNFKVFVWNKDHSAFNLSRLKVSSEKGNPYFYGLFEKF